MLVNGLSVKLLLLRHGQTTGNVDRRLQGSEDPLTLLGQRQARELASYLAGRGDVVALYASPYVRALETARAVGEAVGMDPVLRSDLAELDVGEAAGYRFDDWVEKFPQEAERFRSGGVEYAWPGGESGQQLSSRVSREMDHIIGKHRGEEGAVVVVSHGGALAWMLVHLLREPVDEWPSEYLHIANCSVTEVEVRDDGSPVTVVLRNETGHLSPEPDREPDPDAEAATGEDPD